MSRLPDPGEPDPQDAERLAELKEILLGDVRSRIERVEERLDASEIRTEEVAGVLPDAIVREAASGDRLSSALAPTVEQALQVSIRRNPEALAAAVSPIMGPAIRKSILQAIAGMVQSMNSAMEQSFSPQGIRWRIEAMRTGKSFGEIVALRTLLYQVEEVFVIHRETALLIAHRSIRESTDADVVGSMLVAIRDFVKDSFRGEDGGTLDTIQVGDRTVWAETGRDTVLAAVIRGQAPHSLRGTLVETLEEIEIRYGSELESFDGDDGPFENVASDQLAECMLAQARDDDGGADPKKSYGMRVVWSVVGLALLVFVGLRVRDGMHWARFVESLEAEPGIVVIDSDKQDGRRVVRGLRDPYSVDPSTLLAGTRFRPDDVLFRLEGYQSLEGEMVLARARETLDPPAGVDIDIQGTRLVVSGSPPSAWLRDAAARVTALGGGTFLVFDGEVREMAALRELADTLAGYSFLFAPGSARLTGAGAEVAAARATLVRADSLAALAGGAQVTLVGSTDPTGDPQLNARLAVGRAQAVLAALVPAELPSLRFEVEASPSRAAGAPGRDEDRSVRFRMTLPTR